MSDEQKGLKKIDASKLLPTGFELLSEAEQREVVKKMTEQDLEARGDLLKKVNKSRVAEHEMANTIETMEHFDEHKKYYSLNQSIETGSGKIDLQIKGGDTKFIIPILIALAIILVTVGIVFLK